MLSAEEVREIEAETTRYPRRDAACIDALKIVQRHRGWISDEGIRDVAGLLNMSADEVDGIASFYSLLFRKPVGRHVILLCDSVSCWVMGYETMRRRLEELLQIKLGETTPDDRFTLLPIVCLGCCDRAPAMLVDRDLHVNLDGETIGRVLGKYS